MKRKKTIYSHPKIIRNIKKVSNRLSGIKREESKPNKSNTPTNNISSKNTSPIKNIKDIDVKSKRTVYIVGGGPSLDGFDFKILNGRDVIAVNKSIEYLDNVKYFITMDYTFLKKTKLSIHEINKRCEKSIFILNNGEDYIKKINGIYTDTRTNLRYDNLVFFNNIIESKNSVDPKTGFGTTINNYQHGNNSGYCALQLALLLGYDEINLLGFDLNYDKTKTHFHKGYMQNIGQFSSRLNLYRNNFIRSIKLSKLNNVYSCTNTSYLNHYITYRPIHKSFNKNNIEENNITTVKNNQNVNQSDDLRDVVFVAYYTINTPYEKEAAKLIKSLNKLNLKHDVVGVPNLGNWQANTRFKAKFMLDMLDKHIGSKLVYVDSDAIIHKRPELFSNYDCDISVRWQDFRWRKNECLSGTIYMDNNEKTRELCRRWLQINDSEGPNAKTFEQWNLGTVINEMEKEGKITTKNLPHEYTFIFDSMRQIYPNAVAVIEHFQASRRYRTKV